MRVHLTAEHTLELEVAHLALQALRLLADVPGGTLIALALGQVQELGGVCETLGRTLDLDDVGA
jgi:hypothetical protein